MTNDDFLNKVKATIKERIESDKQIKLYRQKVAQGTASIRETIKQNSHIANLIGTTLSDFMPTAEAGQGLREFICREILRDQHRDTNAMLAQVQKAIDEKLGLQLKAKTAPFPAERVDTVAHSLEDPTVAIDVIQRRARSATENVINSYADDFVKENAKLRSDAGLKCYLTRYTSGNCCKWCDDLAGKYDYESAPDDIFRRHDNCDCVVTYECGRMRQDVWSKKSWEAPETDKTEYKPQVLSREQAKSIEAKNMRFKGVDKSGESGIIIKEQSKEPITEITDKAIESVPKIKIDGYTDEQCELIQQHHKELLKYSRDNNNSKEVAFVMDSSMSSRKEFIGSDDKLDFGSELYGKDLFVMHNHPRNSSFSDRDIRFIIENDNIKTLTIIKNNGSVEVLTKSGVYEKRKALIELKRCYKKFVNRDTDEEINKAISAFLKNNKGLFEWIKK